MIQNAANPHWIVSTLYQTSKAFDKFYLNSSLILGLQRQNHGCLKYFQVSCQILDGSFRYGTELRVLGGYGCNTSIFPSIYLCSHKYECKKALWILREETKELENEARRFALMCAYPTVFLMQFQMEYTWTTKKYCPSISDVQETKVHANQNSYRTSGTSSALSFNSF